MNARPQSGNSEAKEPDGDQDAANREFERIARKVATAKQPLEGDVPKKGKGVIRNRWILLGLLPLLAWPLASQQNDRLAIAVVAARAVRADAELPEGTTRVIASKGMEAAAHRVAQALGGNVTTLASARPCGKLPSTCRLVGAPVLLELREPVITDDVATMGAEVYWETPSKRQPVAYKSVVVFLKRVNGTWAVTRQQLQEIT